MRRESRRASSLAARPVRQRTCVFRTRSSVDVAHESLDRRGGVIPDSASMRPARLSVTQGSERGREIPLARESIVLGRSNSADFAIDDERMSRHHARIASRDGAWTIEDLGSANGTRLNGVDVTQARPLAHGDEIGVGRTTMRFELLEEIPPPLPANAPAARGDADGGLVGRTIGGYQILAEIGRGAVGFVYRARQTSLDREVALKVLAPRFAADPAFVRRFVSESAAAARLSHPNVVQVYDAGSDQGLYFFSMELMRGGSLDRKLAALRGERFSVHTALSAVLDAARGMQFSESCGIIHRDIKPDNLMLTDDGVVKIGDLGIAVEAGDTDVKRSGTPAYLAPEVVDGARPSAASDIYGLGATLYRMLAGRTPYEAAGAAETLRRVREGPPPSLESVAPSLPSEVYELVARMMARRPQHRPKSAGEIVDAVERMRLDREVKKAAKAAAAGPRSPLWSVAYVVVVGGGIGAAVVYALREKPEPEPAPPSAPQPTVVEAPTERAESDPATALAREAIAALLRKETTLGAVELAKKDAWRALASEYDAFEGRFPDATRQRATARKRSAWITDALAKLEASERKAADDASRLWNERRGKIEALERDERWTESADLAAQTLRDPTFLRMFDRVEGSRQFLFRAPERACVAAANSLDAALKQARALQAEHDLAAALAVVKQWTSKWRPCANVDSKIDELVRAADDYVVSAKAAEIQRVAVALTADVVEMTNAIAGSAPCRGDKLALRFADARASLTEFVPRAKTWLVKRRVERRVARLVAAEAAWTAFVERFAHGEVVPDGAVIAWAPGVPPAATAKLALGRTPTADGFSLDLVVGAASARKSVAWTDVPVGVVASNLLAPSAGRVSGADAAGLMWLCIELRQPLVAADCLARAGLSADETASARFEIDAVRDWARAMTPTGGAPVDLSKWRLKYAASDIGMTLDAAMRPAPTSLFTDAEIKAYVDGGGVEPR
jgi:hypothetical protein